ncbi:hypothetical protein N3K66_006420 [Trichothecium roseum]|uniref:Uncharacterized protein n=1 Tax=Trichothecium roseum TaxID=47278 RepID=A0ACC0UX01_9HYPO|nr:hypothetical protein N3K66_006420 [Trichothecium roseum]
MAPPSVWLLALLHSGSVVAASAVAGGMSISRQVRLGNVEYFVPPTASWHVEDWDPAVLGAEAEGDLVPLTVVALTVVTLTDQDDDEKLEDILRDYAERDDVWNSMFEQAILVDTENKGNSSNATTPDGFGSGSGSLLRHGMLKVGEWKGVTTNGTLTNGPYFLHRYTGKAYQAYRLYADTSQAFLQSSYQDPDGNHHPLPAAIASDAGLTIAVPSRLYHATPPPANKPLAGIRISVKDLFHLRGLRTSFGNKALYSLSPRQNATAAAVQRLVDAGAVVVGKNKLSEFGYGGPFATEHVDYLLPVNPRGDGYNSPGDSSGGGGSAVASYDWLDASLGTDTGGSVRAPAHVNGVLGNRPTQDGVSARGALPLSPTLDTVGVLARDPAIWSRINAALLEDDDDAWEKQYARYPSQIIVDPVALRDMQDYNVTHPELSAAIHAFTSALANVTSAAVNRTNFEMRWDETRPRPDDGLDGLPLGQVVHEGYRNITAYEQWDRLGRVFVGAHKALHDGEFPHVTPRVRDRWLWANGSDAGGVYHRDMAYLDVYRRWAARNFLVPDEESCSNALFVYFSPPSYAYLYKPDVSTDSANPFINNLLTQTYSAQADLLSLNITLSCSTDLGTEASCASARRALDDFSAYENRLSPLLAVSLAGFPDVCVPLGSFSMGDETWSNSTTKEQRLPLGVDIVAARGCDAMLHRLVGELHQRGVVKKPRTGSIV